jgi:hypothetical protein
MKKLLKMVALVLVTVGLQACMSGNYHTSDYSGPEDATFTDALATKQWIKDEYKEYQSRRGYKAFAIAVGFPELIIATGFADDKVSKQAAYNEALRMCRHFSQGDGECRVVDEQVSNGYTGLTKKQIDDAPKELIAHRDIRQYVQYKKAEAPKAFIVAACSGQSFWFEQQNSKQEAEEKGLQKCEYNRHESDPCCTVLDSE